MTSIELHALYPDLLARMQSRDALLYTAVRLVSECGISLKDLLVMPSRMLYSHSEDSFLQEPFDTESLPDNIRGQLPRTGYLFGPDFHYIQLNYKLTTFIAKEGVPSFTFRDLLLYYSYRCLIAGKGIQAIPSLRGSKYGKARAFGLSLREYIKLLGLDEDFYFAPKSGYAGADYTLMSTDLSRICDILLYAACVTVGEHSLESIQFFLDKFKNSCSKNAGISPEAFDYQSLYNYMERLSDLAANGFLRASDIHQLMMETERLCKIHLNDIGIPLQGSIPIQAN